MEKKYFNPVLAVLLFLLIALTVPFCESKKVIFWQNPRETLNFNIFADVLLKYAHFSEYLKEKISPDYSISAPKKVLPSVPIPKEEPQAGQKRILIIGDSFIAVQGGVGDILEKELVKYKDANVFRMGKVSSGLSRKDYFNWSETAQNLMEQYNPNVVIAMFGTNDLQDLTSPYGKVEISIKNANWGKEYQNRIAELIGNFEGKAEVFGWVCQLCPKEIMAMELNI